MCAPKGVGDGERPLKFSLPDWILIENLDLYFYLISEDILRAFQKDKFDYKFSPDLEKFADIFLHVFSTRCSFGANHEVGSPEDADMMPPEGYYALLEEPCLN